MRQYLSLTDALNETIRELFSRGQLQFDSTVQGKIVTKDKFEMKELFNYNYMYTPIPGTVIPNEIEDMLKIAKSIFNRDQHQYNIAFKWFKSFFNPSMYDTWWESSKFLSKYWLSSNAISHHSFSYTYGERLWDGIPIVIEKLQDNPSSRGAYLPVWYGYDLMSSRLHQRVPCTIGYQFYIRNKELSLNIYQRSCDLVNFYPLDISKAVLLQLYILRELTKDNNKHLTFGSTTHYISSLHAYKIDVPENRKW